jgi:diguanylate cyclase (GGDEF)-like protein/PAS domain S-box-containing protein
MFTAEPAIRAAFLTDQAGNITAWNEGCQALFGVPAEEILGRPLSELLVGTDRQEWPDRWVDLVTQARTEGLEVSLRCASGRTMSAVLTLAREYDRNGELICCVAAVTTGLNVDASESERVAQMPLGSMVNLFPGTFYAISRERRFVLWNHNLELVQEMTPEELAAANPLDCFDLAERPLIAEKIREVFDEGAEVTVEADVIGKSGRETPMMLCGARIACCGTDYLFGVGIDITERRQQEEKLRLRERALHAASNGIMITRCEGRDNPIEYVNPAFERITGYSANEVIGRDPRFMAASGLDVNERAKVRAAIRQQRPVNVVFRNMRKNGELFWNDLNITPVEADGKATHSIGVMIDVTANKQRTAHLEHEVNHDALTGLANRNLLWDRLEQGLHLAQRNKSLVATVLIDLNNFKTINDSFGHEAGDVVLKVVAKRLQASVRDSDTVARLSGDEFVLVLVNQPSLRYTLRMIERVRAGLTTPVSFNRQEIPVGASIGVALYPHDGTGVAELIRAADVAMYHAKATGKDEVYFFSPDMKSTTEAKQKLEAGMREALRHDQLFLMYQPRVDLHSGRVCGFEALLRWQHPEQGVMLPPAFLPEAEENGCIIEIGNRVLDQACAFLGHLREGGFDDLSMSVNISHREFSQPDFIAGIATRLERHALPAERLQIELRGDDLMRDMGLGREVANQLHAMGLPLSVDDFGDGLAHLNYLQQLSATGIKIAKGAVHAIENGGPRSAIAKSVIDIGHNLNMSVIAEAVETRGQLEFLRAHGCDQIQGSCFSGPLRAEAAEQMLRERHFA